MSLEAWYLADLDVSEEWGLEPQSVIDGTAAISADDLIEAHSLIYPTTISLHKDRLRITVPKLLTTFAAGSGPLARTKIMVSLEGESLAVWTYSAFQTHFGSVGK